MEALDAEDWDAAYELLDPDVELTNRRGTVRGADAVRALWAPPEFSHLRGEVEAREFGEAGHAVLVTTLLAFRWKESGDVAYRSWVRMRLAIRDGRIARIHVAYPEHRAA